MALIPDLMRGNTKRKSMSTGIVNMQPLLKPEIKDQTQSLPRFQKNMKKETIGF